MLPSQWKTQSNILYRIAEYINLAYDFELSPNLAVFDISSLIQSDRGLPHPVIDTDWLWVNDSLPDHLRQLELEGFTVIIIGYQEDTDLEELEWLTRRVENMFDQLGFVPDVYISLTPNLESAFRMFLSINRITPTSRSFYVSTSSLNLSTRYTSAREIFNWDEPTLYKSNQQELIVIVTPIDDVTSLAGKYFTNFTVVSGGSSIGNRYSVRKLLSQQRSVVVGGHNASRRAREPLLSLAAELRVPVKIFWFSKGTQEKINKKYAEDFDDPREDGVEVIRVN